MVLVLLDKVRERVVARDGAPVALVQDSEVAGGVACEAIEE
jgi:hypothetical protein